MDTDFVDCAVSGWAKQWPKLKTSPFEVTGRLERIARHLDRRTTQAVSSTGLSPRDLEVLGALRRADSDTGLPASECAKAAMLTSGGMTGEADRLANAGLIVRKPDPDDRRAVLMSLTPHGNEVAEEGLKAYLEASDEVLGVLTESERATLADLLRKLLLGLEGTTTERSDGEAAKGVRSGRPRRLKRFE